MSKREASGYLTKEDGLVANPEGPNAPKMASAATMRGRKIKAPRSRLGASSSASPFSISQTTSNPFTNPNIATNGGHQSIFSGLNGAPTFGQTQSFPPPSNSGSTFNFNPPTTASFPAFGQGPSNPFASAQNSSTGSTFAGFGPPSQNADDMMEESPQKQKKFNFGTAVSSGPSASTTFQFGQPATSNGPVSFGASTAEKPTDSPFKFGQSVQSNGPVNFGAPSATQPSSTPFSFSQGSLFGGPKPDTQDQSNPQATSSAEPPSSIFKPSAPPTSTTNNLFGQSHSSETPSSSDPSAQQSTAVEATSTLAPAPLNKLFGGPAASVTSSTEPTTSSSLFGQPTSTTPTPFSFGQPPSISNAPSSAATFGNVFGKSPPQSAGDSGSPAAETTSKTPSTTPSFSGFTPQKDPQSTTSNFSFAQSSDTSKRSKTSDLFSAAAGSASTNSGRSTIKSYDVPSHSEQENSININGVSALGNSKDAGASTSGGLFDRINRPEPQPQNQTSPTKEISMPAFSVFQPRSSEDGSPSSSAPATGNTFGTQQNKNTGVNKSNSNTFNFTSPAAAKSSSTFATEKSYSSSSQALAAPQPSASASENPKVRLKTHGSSDIPGYLDNDDRAEYDRAYRLRSLNEEFQRRIMMVDSASHDFDTLVRFYCGVRDTIGAPLGLYQRNKAGTKRKTGNDVSDETQNDAKRSKGDAASSLSNVNVLSNTNLPNSLFGSQSEVTPGFKTSTEVNVSAPASSTSNMFKSLMNTPSSEPLSNKATYSSAPALNPFGSLNAPNWTASDAALTAAAKSKPFAEPAVISNPFTSLGASFEAPKSSIGGIQAGNSFAAFNNPKSNPPNPTSTAPPESIFKPNMASTTPIKSPPKPPTFQVPAFGGGSAVNFMAAFAKQSQANTAKMEAEEKRKRKAEDFDSDEDDEAEFDRKYEEEQRAKRGKLEALAKAGSAGFQPHLTKDNSSISKPLNQEAPNASTDSGEDLQATSATKPQQNDDEGMDEEHSSSGESGQDDGDDADGEADEDYDQEVGPEDEQEVGSESDDDDIQEAMSKSRGKSLFDRIEPNPNLNANGTSKDSTQEDSNKPNGVSTNSFEINSTFGGTTSESPFKGGSGAPSSVFNSTNFGTPKAPTWSPFTPVNGAGAKTGLDDSAAAAKADDKPPTPNPASKDLFAAAGSIFSTTPKTAPSTQPFFFGGSTSLGTEALPPGTGLFGSRPGTPSNAESSGGSVFGGLGNKPAPTSSQGDNTWKPGTPIKFGSPNTSAPTVSVTAATPPPNKDDSTTPKPFSNLFGGSGTPSKQPSSNASSVGFGFGLPSASPLLGPSLIGSGVSSRATSPGATDTESVGTDTEDHSNEPQASFMNFRPGEENEEIIFEGRAKALKMMNAEQVKGTKNEAGWVTQGVGPLRILKHKTTGKVRMVLRAEPGSNVIMNTALVPSMDYKSQESKGSGAVRFGVPTNVSVESWVIKVKTNQMADELAGILEAQKGAKK